MRKLSRSMKSILAISMAFAVLTTSACGKQYSEDNLDKYDYEQELNVINDNVRNYYEIFVYSYYDSDGDGIGDINGVTKKLDYIKDMGFNGIWLMPIMAAPSYHKYDTTDYESIDDEYGTIEDFKKLLEEAHKRDIKIIIDFMFNHTSNMHPWFTEAYRYYSDLGKKKPDASECPYIDYYNFVKEEDAKTGYHKVGNSDWYYEGAFVNTMPDLNLSSDVVRGEIEKAAKFWLDMGVDGFRLDGVKYYTGIADGNIEILTWFNSYVKSIKSDAYIVSEVWDNYNEASKYLASGINSTFDFTGGQSSGYLVSYARQAGNGIDHVGQEFANTMVNIEERTKEINPDATVAEFLTNHDTGRTANILCTEEKVKLGYALELFMSGNVFVYYGEEIALTGAGSDPNFRAPMYWSATDKTGKCDGPKEMDRFENDFAPLDEQQKDPNSVNYFIKRCLRIRNENPEIGRGTTAVIPEIKDEDVCAITRTYNDSKLVMLYNLSKEEKKLTVSKDTYGYEDIRGYVCVNGGVVTLDKDTVTLPPYSVVILK